MIIMPCVDKAILYLGVYAQMVFITIIHQRIALEVSAIYIKHKKIFCPIFFLRDFSIIAYYCAKFKIFTLTA